MFIPPWAEGVVVVVAAVWVASVATSIVRKVLGLPRTTVAMPGSAGPEVAELRETMDAMQQRMLELEERVDFAERALKR